jgi:hypothetical protein
MLADALLDPSSRGDIFIDPFLGSGSTLIAADKIGHVSWGVDLDSLYIDVIIRQYAAATGNPAVLIETGEAFDALARVGQGRQRRTRAEFQRRALGTSQSCEVARISFAHNISVISVRPNSVSVRDFLAIRGRFPQIRASLWARNSVSQRRMLKWEFHSASWCGPRFDPSTIHQEVGASRPGFPAPTIPRLFSALARKLMVCGVYSAGTTGLGRRTRK